jgi:hypothetical protein
MLIVPQAFPPAMPASLIFAAFGQVTQVRDTQNCKAVLIIFSVDAFSLLQIYLPIMTRSWDFSISRIDFSTDSP